MLITKGNFIYKHCDQQPFYGHNLGKNSKLHVQSEVKLIYNLICQQTYMTT